MIEGKLVNTTVGETITVFPIDDVGLIFAFVVKKGSTTVNKEPETRPDPPSGFKIKQYYEIRTEALYSGKIKIIIFCDSATELWQFNERTRKWKNITKNFNPTYHLIIGETDHLSMFGVT